MSSVLRYGAAATVAVSVCLALLWPLLDRASWLGVAIAAVVAVPVQVVAFSFLDGRRAGIEGFLAAWVGGMVARAVVIVLAAVFVIRSGFGGAVPMLLALAAFFMGLVLLEPAFFRPEPKRTV